MQKLWNLFKSVWLWSATLTTYFSLLNLLVIVERYDPNSNIKNFYDAFWFSIVTVTSVGYGDKYPITGLGKAISLVFILASVGFLGFLFGRISNFFNMINQNQRLGLNGTNFKNHFVIIGWDDFSKAIAEKLIQVGQKVAVVVDDSDEVDLIYQNYSKENMFVLFSDFNSWTNLKLANLDLADKIFLNLKDDTEKLVYILDLKKHFSKVEAIVILENSNLQETFVSAGIKYALSKNDIVSQMVVGYVTTPDVTQYSQDLLTSNDEDVEVEIKEFVINKKHAFYNKTYQEAFLRLKENFNAVLIGIAKNNINGERKLLQNPLVPINIDFGDYLVLMINKNKKKEITSFFEKF